MAKTFATVLGVIFVLVGIIGFINHDFLGMHLSNAHNWIHLISGIVALYFGTATDLRAARSFDYTFGALYLLLGLFGFMLGRPSVATVPGGAGGIAPDSRLWRLIPGTLEFGSVDLICLAGYMRLLSPAFVQAFPQRIINIHPSLLPAFPGLDAQKQALEYGAKITGCTVHFVDEDLDHGPIIAQRAVPVLEADTVESLSARILEQEHIAYSEAIAIVLAGGCEIRGRCVVTKKSP